MLVLALLVLIVFLSFMIMRMTGENDIMGKATAYALTYYVDPVNGNNNNPGTIDAPFKTLNKAKNAVNAAKGGATGPIAIYFREGTYELVNTYPYGTIKLFSSDSGTADKPITYKAYPGERVTFSGAITLAPSWEIYDVNKNIYRTDVSSLYNTYGDFDSLYVDGYRAQRARDPNTGWKINTGHTASQMTVQSAADISANWRNLNDIEAVGNYNWISPRLKIASVNGLVVNFDGSVTTWLGDFGSKYYFENVFEKLDAEGEWYLDESEKKLYYKPKTGKPLGQSVFKVPVMETLMTMSGTSYVNFEGIEFKFTDWNLTPDVGYPGDQASIQLKNAAAVEVAHGASHIGFRNNTFSHMGTNGITLTKSSYITIDGNKFNDFGAVAIKLGWLRGVKEGQGEGDYTHHVTIANNRINGVGRVFHDAVAVLVSHNHHVDVSYNEIADGYYTGVSVGMSWDQTPSNAHDNTVSHNYIHDFMQWLSDGGGVYTLGNQPGTIVNENIITDVTGSLARGIFLDQGSSYITISNNNLCRTSIGVGQNSPGPGNVIQNNDYNKDNCNFLTQADYDVVGPQGVECFEASDCGNGQCIQMQCDTVVTTTTTTPTTIPSTTTTTTLLQNGFTPVLSEQSGDLVVSISQEQQNINYITDWRVDMQSIAMLNMPFDMGPDGTIVNDYSTSNNEGNISNAVWIPNGHIGGAYQFNQDMNSRIYKELANLPTGQRITVSAWIYPESYPDQTFNGIISWGERSSKDSFVLAVQNTGRPSFSSWGNDFVPASGPSANLNQWNHIAAVLNGNSVKLYINGQRVDGTLASKPSVNMRFLAIGCTEYTNPTRCFDGRIDDVLVFDDSLSDEQIQLIYSQESQGKHFRTVDNGNIYGGNWAVAVTANNGASESQEKMSNSISIPYAASLNYYVDPTYGSDSNSGTIDAPFKTIEKARNTIRTLKNNNQFNQPVTVYLRGGTFRLGGPITFSSQDSGETGKPITYTNYPGEKVIISGSKQITPSWTLYDQSKNIYSADVSEFYDQYGNFSTLFVDGERAIRARTPNTGWYIASDNQKTHFTITHVGDVDPAWRNLRDVEIVSRHLWFSTRFKIDHIDGMVVFVQGGIKNSESFYILGQEYFVENVFEKLDAEGEWYLDESEKKLYYKPRSAQNINQAVFAVPVTDQLLNIEGTSQKRVKDINFRNLFFRYTDWTIEDSVGFFSEYAYEELITHSAIEILYSDGLSFINNNIEKVGYWGMSVYRSDDIEIIGNKFDDSGSGAIKVGYHVSDREVPLNSVEGHPYISYDILIRDNVVSRVGRIFMGTTAIALGTNHDVDVLYNEVYDAPNLGIKVGGGQNHVQAPTRDNDISYNYVHNVMQIVKDGGGIYTTGTMPGTVISYNIITDITRGMPPGGSIYHDEGSAYITTVHNRMCNVPVVGDHGDGIDYNWASEATITTINNSVRTATCVGFLTQANYDAVGPQGVECFDNSECSAGDMCIGRECTSVSLENDGELCTFDAECTHPNCDPDISGTGTKRCHPNADKCVVDATGSEAAAGTKKCRSNYRYKECSLSGADPVWSSLTPVLAGKVCKDGASVPPSGASDCGTGNENCFCAVWRDCNTGVCSADEYYTGFLTDGGCTATGWLSKGTSWNVPIDYRISADTDAALCTTSNTDGTASYTSCTNQYTKHGTTGYCNGNGALKTTTASVDAGHVCKNAMDVLPSGSSDCGTGAQNCWCANDWKQCDSAHDCTHDLHLVGFSSTGLCEATGSVEITQNIANQDTYQCIASSDAVSCTGMCTNLFDTEYCFGTSKCSAGACNNAPTTTIAPTSTTVTTTSSTTSSSTTTTTSGGSGGGGGGGGGSSSTTSSISYPSISANVLKTWKISSSAIYVTQISFETNQAIVNSRLALSQLSSDPPTSAIKNGAVFKYFEINAQNFGNGISSAYITFKVRKIWIQQNSLTNEDIVLFRFNNGAWAELPTEYTETDDTTYDYFKATSPGFSYFAIGVKESEMTTTTTTASSTTTASGTTMTTEIQTTTTSDEASTTTTTEKGSETESPSEGKKGFKNITYLIGALMILVAIAGVYVSVKYHKKKEEHEPIAKSQQKPTHADITDIISYVEQALLNGMKKQEIKQKMIAVGWKENEADSVIAITLSDVPSKGETKAAETYIGDYVKEGVNKDVIRSKMINAGWKEEDIEKIFKSLEI